MLQGALNAAANPPARLGEEEAVPRRYSVLMLAACPFPANYGTPGCIKEMSETMAERGHEVHILTYPLGDDLPVRGAQIHRIPSVGRPQRIQVGPTLQKPLLDFLMVIQACRLIRRHRCDLIHAHNYEGQLVGICARFLTGRPLLYNAVNAMSDELSSYDFIKPAFLARWLATFLDWFVPRFADHILALTSELRGLLIRQGTPSERVTVVPAGIFPEMFARCDPLRFRQALDLGDGPIVLYAGTLDHFQRVDLMVDAFAQVSALFPKAILLIVCPFSQPELHAKLAARIEELGIVQQTRWVLSHPLEDLPDYLALGDVAVLPRPLCPGHPIKLLNYMGASRPIVASEGGGKGIRHLQNGLLFRDGDAAHLAENIMILLRDRDLAARLGQAARQTVLDDYDWRKLCAKIEGIYHGIVVPTPEETVKT